MVKWWNWGLKDVLRKLAVSLLWHSICHRCRIEIKLPVCLNSEALSFAYQKSKLVKTVLFCELQKCKGKLYWRLVSEVKWLSGKIMGGARRIMPQWIYTRENLQTLNDIQVNIWGPNFKISELPLNARTTLGPFLKCFFYSRDWHLFKKSVWKQTSKSYFSES